MITFFSADVGDVELKDVIEKNSIITVSLDPLSMAERGEKAALVRGLLEGVIAEHTAAIRSERMRLLEIAARQGGTIESLCEHTLRDEFHGGGVSEFRCLVCGFKGEL